MYAAGVHALSQLGQGKKNGGTKDHQKNRFDVLDRVRSVSELSESQAVQWVPFRIAWDEKMAYLHQENWGRVFSEMAMALLNDLSEKKADALSVFLDDEKQRVLGDVPMLCLPGAPHVELGWHFLSCTRCN